MNLFDKYLTGKQVDSGPALAVNAHDVASQVAVTRIPALLVTVAANLRNFPSGL